MKIRTKDQPITLFSSDLNDAKVFDANLEIDVPAIFAVSAAILADQNLVIDITGKEPEAVVEDKPSLRDVVFAMLEHPEPVFFTPNGELKLVQVRDKFGAKVDRAEVDALVEEYNSIYPERLA